MHANLSTYQQIISKISGSGGYADGDTMKLRKMSGEYKKKRKISFGNQRRIEGTRAVIFICRCGCSAIFFKNDTSLIMNIVVFNKDFASVISK